MKSRLAPIVAVMVGLAVTAGLSSWAWAEEPAAEKPKEEKKPDQPKPDEKKPDDKKDKKKEDTPTERPASIGTFYDVPAITANLLSQANKHVYLVINIVLEMKNETDRPKLDQIIPIVLDAFLTYLVQLTPANLQGSEGLYRLKQELLARAQAVCFPVEINDVLIKEMLVK